MRLRRKQHRCANSLNSAHPQQEQLIRVEKKEKRERKKKEEDSLQKSLLAL